MSKSDRSDLSRINLSDSADTIESKIMQAKTDSIEKFYIDEENRPEVTNLATIYASIAGIDIKEVERKYESLSMREFKVDLAEILVKELAPISNNIEVLTNQAELIEPVLIRGQSEAFDAAEKNLMLFKDAMNLLI